MPPVPLPKQCLQNAARPTNVRQMEKAGKQHRCDRCHGHARGVDESGTADPQSPLPGWHRTRIVSCDADTVRNGSSFPGTLRLAVFRRLEKATLLSACDIGDLAEYAGHSL
jgi:hypothetical protein